MLGSALVLSAVHAGTARAACKNLPSHRAPRQRSTVVTSGDNAGLGNEMWATVVDRDGLVCRSPSLAATGRPMAGQPRDLGPKGQYRERLQPARRRRLRRRTVQRQSVRNGPGAGRLFGLQFSNPVDPAVAYNGPPQNRPVQRSDDRQAIGGVNVFGGGLAFTTAATCSAASASAATPRAPITWSPGACVMRSASTTCPGGVSATATTT